MPFEFEHKPRRWHILLGFNDDDYKYSLEINGVRFEEMTEAPPRERAELARTAI